MIDVFTKRHQTGDIAIGVDSALPAGIPVFMTPICFMVIKGLRVNLHPTPEKVGLLAHM
jgi:hypothetical protein